MFPNIKDKFSWLIMAAAPIFSTFCLAGMRKLMTACSSWFYDCEEDREREEETEAMRGKDGRKKRPSIDFQKKWASGTQFRAARHHPSSERLVRTRRNEHKNRCNNLETKWRGESISVMRNSDRSPKGASLVHTKSKHHTPNFPWTQQALRSTCGWGVDEKYSYLDQAPCSSWRFWITGWPIETASFLRETFRARISKVMSSLVL